MKKKRERASTAWKATTAWMPTRQRRETVAATLAGLSVILAGCSGASGGAVPSSPEPTTYSLQATFEERTGVPLEDAVETLGMSEQTHEIYAHAVDRGYVLASDVAAVIPELRKCIEPLGFTVEHDPSQIGYFGLPDTTWSIVVPVGHEMSDSDDAVITSCADRTVGPLENAFFNQPHSPERSEVWSTDGRREAAQNCIEAEGYFAPDDGSMQRYIDIAREVLKDDGTSECLDIVLYGAASP